MTEPGGRLATCPTSSLAGQGEDLREDSGDPVSVFARRVINGKDQASA